MKFKILFLKHFAGIFGISLRELNNPDIMLEKLCLQCKNSMSLLVCDQSQLWDEFLLIDLMVNIARHTMSNSVKLIYLQCQVHRQNRKHSWHLVQLSHFCCQSYVRIHDMKIMVYFPQKLSQYSQSYLKLSWY